MAELCRRENLGPELPTCPHCLLRLDEPVQDLLLPQVGVRDVIFVGNEPFNFSPYLPLKNRERTLSRPDSTTPAAEVASAAAAVFAGAAGSRSMDGTLDLWPDVSCLVCQLLRGGSRRAVCCECGEDGQSYVCLLCGSVGCGRQQHAHGLAHFRSTGHPFSAEVKLCRG